MAHVNTGISLKVLQVAYNMVSHALSPLFLVAPVDAI